MSAATTAASLRSGPGSSIVSPVPSPGSVADQRLWPKLNAPHPAGDRGITVIPVLVAPGHTTTIVDPEQHAPVPRFDGAAPSSDNDSFERLSKMLSQP